MGQNSGPREKVQSGGQGAPRAETRPARCDLYCATKFREAYRSIYLLLVLKVQPLALLSLLSIQWICLNYKGKHRA